MHVRALVCVPQVVATLSVGSDEHAAAEESLADALLEYSTVLIELSQPARAVPMLRRALKIQTSCHGERCEAALSVNDMLARALAGAGEGAEVVPTLRRSLDLKRSLHGDGSQEVADCHNEV